MIYEFRDYYSGPKAYDVISETPKQMKVRLAGSATGRIAPVNKSDIDLVGGHWFSSESAAWEFERAKQQRKMQQLTTQKSQCSSRIDVCNKALAALGVTS